MFYQPAFPKLKKFTRNALLPRRDAGTGMREDVAVPEHLSAPHTPALQGGRSPCTYIRNSSSLSSESDLL